MKHQPEVSVVVPAYNREKTLERCVQSALGQTFRDFEVIIVDDGSSDNTTDVALSSGDARVRLIRHRENRGAGAARNTGAQAAKGEYIAWLDSDDEWLPMKLERQLDVLKRDTDHSSVCCTAFYLIQHDRAREARIPPNPVSWFKQLLLGSGIAPGTTLLIKKPAFFEVGPLDESLRRMEDWDWLLRFAKRRRILTVDEPLAIVYRGARPPATLMEEVTLRFVDKHYGDFFAFGAFYGRKAIAKRWLELAASYLGEKSFRKGLFYLCKALTTNPLQRPGLYLTLLDAALGTSIGVGFRRLRHAGLLSFRRQS